MRTHRRRREMIREGREVRRGGENMNFYIPRSPFRNIIEMFLQENLYYFHFK